MTLEVAAGKDERGRKRSVTFLPPLSLSHPKGLSFQEWLFHLSRVEVR